MKINIRMNLVLASIGAIAIAIAIAIAVSSAVLWSYLDTKSIEGVRRDAEMQTRTAEAIRSYTVEHVQSVMVNGDEPNAPFHKEAVPPCAAGTALAYLYQSMGGTPTVRSPSTRPTRRTWRRAGQRRSSMTFGSRTRSLSCSA